MIPKQTLLCIPDISGFTKFMSTTDFELSSKVIPSLLNKIIYSNEIGLKVSEIEGDAVLFFKSGKLPTFSDLVNQCKRFYTEFYSQLNELRTLYSEENGANRIPQILGLKIVLHYSNEIGKVPVGKSIKLMGEDVIAAHRLLKNNIPLDEYVLFSEELIAQYNGVDHQNEFEWGDLKEDFIEVEHMGKIRFNYISLTPLVE